MTLVVWIAQSLLLYVVWRQVAWFYRQPRPGWFGRLAARRAPPILVESVRALYFVGIPYWALLQGVASPRLYGLIDVDWLRSLGLGGGLAAGVLLMLAALWGYHARATRGLRAGDEIAAASERRRLAEAWGWVYLLRDVIYLQAHWAFYRAGPTLVLRDAYAGAFIGLALVLVEWASDPAWRESLQTPSRVGDTLLTASLALVTTVVFVQIPNLWWTAVLHLALWLALLSLLRRWYSRSNLP